MTPAETVSRLRRLADDWRKEEKQLCEQFGSEIIPRSMRARRIKDTKAIDAAVEMIETMKQQGRVISAQPAPSVPEGWKLVPIEPTEEMREVGVFAGGAYYDVVEAVYEAMIAAAPEAKP